MTNQIHFNSYHKNSQNFSQIQSITTKFQSNHQLIKINLTVCLNYLIFIFKKTFLILLKIFNQFAKLLIIFCL